MPLVWDAILARNRFQTAYRIGHASVEDIAIGHRQVIPGI
jgi:hypothetical protein